MTLTADMPIWQRVEIIEEALAKVLDRDSSLIVASNGPGCRDRAVWVHPMPGDGEGEPVGHDLHEIARELEALLS
ncbi:hypothetical protein [Frigidibacter oleivorans]|uniref:hypothetical protein n=1 Tax=Frigidibacter oleivorans TaxID=2487129 RepID=UPI000F8CD4EE|nr:hypothetical protein [Frigidibacter oleivorans]